MRLPCGVQAPEVIRHEAYDLAADVYSFGVLLAELLSGHRPYAEDPHLKAVRRKSGNVMPPVSFEPL